MTGPTSTRCSKPMCTRQLIIPVHWTNMTTGPRPPLEGPLPTADDGQIIQDWITSYMNFFNWFHGPNTGPASRCKYCTVGSFFFPLVNCISCKQHISLQGQKCIWTILQSFCGHLAGDGSYYCNCLWLEDQHCCPRPTLSRRWLCAGLSGHHAAAHDTRVHSKQGKRWPPGARVSVWWGASFLRQGSNGALDDTQLMKQAERDSIVPTTWRTFSFSFPFFYFWFFFMFMQKKKWLSRAVFPVSSTESFRITGNTLCSLLW